jgi:hypothetical protein
VFNRQGYPFPLFRNQNLSPDTSLNILVSPFDHFRYDNIFDADLRVAKTFKAQKVSVRVMGDLFNAFNANTVLIRNNNLGSTAFNSIAMNLSPRIFRLGAVVGF